MFCILFVSGYANEVGEAFRSLVPKSVVHGSYGIASLYVLADTVDKSKKMYKVTSPKIATIKIESANEFFPGEPEPPRVQQESADRRRRHPPVAGLGFCDHPRLHHQQGVRRLVLPPQAHQSGPKASEKVANDWHRPRLHPLHHPPHRQPGYPLDGRHPPQNGQPTHRVE